MQSGQITNVAKNVLFLEKILFVLFATDIEIVQILAEKVAAESPRTKR